MLVITGTGRCGTSVLARFCHNCGYIVGGSWNHDANSGMEDSRFVDVSNQLIRGEPEKDTLKYIDTFERRVVKDPRFLRPEVVSAWASRRDDLRILLCVRDMESVCKSFAASGLSDREHLEWATEKTHEVFLSMVEIAQAKIPVQLLAFPHFLDTYDRVHKILTWGELSIDYERGQRIWNGLIDKEKVHF